jgi:hypothetical protein
MSYNSLKISQKYRHTPARPACPYLVWRVSRARQTFVIASVARQSHLSTLQKNSSFSKYADRDCFSHYVPSQ